MGWVSSRPEVEGYGMEQRGRLREGAPGKSVVGDAGHKEWRVQTGQGHVGDLELDFPGSKKVHVDGLMEEINFRSSGYMANLAMLLKLSNY